MQRHLEWNPGLVDLGQLISNIQSWLLDVLLVWMPELTVIPCTTHAIATSFLTRRRSLLADIFFLWRWRLLSFMLLQDQRHLSAPECKIKRVVHTSVERQCVWQRRQSAGVRGELIVVALVTPGRSGLLRTQAGAEDRGEADALLESGVLRVDE